MLDPRPPEPDPVRLPDYLLLQVPLNLETSDLSLDGRLRVCLGF